MKIEVLSLFPECFKGFIESSMVARAINLGILKVDLINYRIFSQNKHRQVDDYPYGGFPGMVIQAEPVYKAISDLVQKSYAPVVYFTPQGRKLNQSILKYYATLPRVILLCGHYKEIDQRVRNLAVSDEISLGDYVLSGGEIPAMAFIDGVSRLLPGVLSDINSADSDSFSQEESTLGFPCYTRPENWMELNVPEELISGNHQKIAQWAKNQSYRLTLTRRPDLKSEK
jgi:tRNA (guanine37-N1)-methyltransferase